MPLILVVDPDRRQAEQLSSLLVGRLQAELVQARSAAEGVGGLGGRTPDLILTSPLLSPKDEAVLAVHLRELGRAATHVQTLTIPVLGTSRPRRARRGVMSVLRRTRDSGATPDGCDPTVFADEVALYLARAREEQQTMSDRMDMAAAAAVDEPVPAAAIILAGASADLTFAYVPESGSAQGELRSIVSRLESHPAGDYRGPETEDRTPSQTAAPVAGDPRSADSDIFESLAEREESAIEREAAIDAPAMHVDAALSTDAPDEIEVAPALVFVALDAPEREREIVPVWTADTALAAGPDAPIVEDGTETVFAADAPDEIEVAPALVFVALDAPEREPEIVPVWTADTAVAAGPDAPIVEDGSETVFAADVPCAIEAPQAVEFMASDAPEREPEIVPVWTADTAVAAGPDAPIVEDGSETVFAADVPCAIEAPQAAEFMASDAPEREPEIVPVWTADTALASGPDAAENELELVPEWVADTVIAHGSEAGVVENGIDTVFVAVHPAEASCEIETHVAAGGTSPAFLPAPEADWLDVVEPRADIAPAPVRWAKEAITTFEAACAALRAAWARPPQSGAIVSSGLDPLDAPAAAMSAVTLGATVEATAAANADGREALEPFDPAARFESAPAAVDTSFLEHDLTAQIDALGSAGLTVLVVVSEDLSEVDMAAPVYALEEPTAADEPDFYEIVMQADVPALVAAPQPAAHAPAGAIRMRAAPKKGPAVASKTTGDDSGLGTRDSRPGAGAAKVKSKKPRRRKEKPAQDEWGMFDPNQCGFAALIDKLDEITDESDDDRDGTNARVVSYQ